MIFFGGWVSDFKGISKLGLPNGGSQEDLLENGGTSVKSCEANARL